jgi:hypothetical protein
MGDLKWSLHKYEYMFIYNDEYEKKIYKAFQKKSHDVHGILKLIYYEHCIHCTI